MKPIAITQTKPLVFLREVKSEMDKVSWPSKKEAIRLTVIVVAASLIMGAYIGSLDFVFTTLMQLLLKK